MATIYDYTLPKPDGSEVSMADFKGKVMLIVNTATGCGFTPHYKPLEEMYEKYHGQGLEIIDVPCNGEGALPLYKYLKSQKSFEGFGKGPTALMMSAMLTKIDKDYKNNPEIKWNFTKFLVDRDGNVVARFEPTHDMKDVGRFVYSWIDV